MFNFFLSSYRKGILTFCGSDVYVKKDINSSDGKVSFKEFENGLFKHRTLTSRHPHILRGTIIGKKSWGLWVEQWSQGIVEGSFTKQEIIKEFTDRDIIIPDVFLKEFGNLIRKKICIIQKSFVY